MKRLLSTLLALCMVLALLPTNALSAEIPIPQETADTNEDVGVDPGLTPLSDPKDVNYDQKNGVISWSLTSPGITCNVFLIELYNQESNSKITVLELGDWTENVTPNADGVYTYPYALPDNLPLGTYYFTVTSGPSGPTTNIYGFSNEVASDSFLVEPKEPTSTVHRVNFFPNGGRIAILEGQNIPTLTAGQAPVYIDAEGKTGVDQNSGIGWTQTNADGKLNSIPTAEREGYVFDGWYKIPDAMDFWSILGSSDGTDEVFIDFSGLEKLTGNAVMNQDCTYVAKWSKASPTTGAFRFLNNSYNIQVLKELQIVALLSEGSKLPTGTKISVSCSKRDIIDVTSVSMQAVGTNGSDITSEAKNGDALIFIDVEGIDVGTVTLTLALPDGRKTTCEVTVFDENYGALLSSEFISCFIGADTLKGEIQCRLTLDGQYDWGDGELQLKDYYTSEVLYSVKSSSDEFKRIVKEETDLDRTVITVTFSPYTTESAFDPFDFYNQKLFIYFDGDLLIDSETNMTQSLSAWKKMLSIKIEPDRWRFQNYDDSYVVEDGSLFKYLLLHASIDESIKILPKLTSGWGGSCYGMSTITVLNSMGKLRADLFNSEADFLFDFQKTTNNEIKSYIHYYQLLQNTDVATANRKSFMKKNTKEQLNVIDTLAHDAEEGGAPFILSFNYYNSKGEKGGHTVVGYGVEDGDWLLGNTSGSKVNHYISRVRIYDCNYQDHLIYFYYNPLDSIWTIIDNTELLTDGVSSIYNGGYKLLEATNDVSILDAQNFSSDYFHSSTSSHAARNDLDFSSLSVASSSNDFRFDLEIDGKKYSIDQYTDERDLGLISYFDCAGSGDSSQTMNLFLPDKSSAYTVIPNAGNSCDYMLNTPSTLLRCEADEAKSISFSQDGTISTEGVSGNYRYSLCFDDEQSSLPWYYTEISGEGSSNMKIAQSKEGIVISGEDLQDMTILTESDSGQKAIMVSTDESKVLLKADQGDNPSVYVDTNHDGNFETALKVQSVSSGNTQFTDVDSNAYYYDAVQWAVNEEITAGTSAAAFSPNSPCNRAQIVTFLWRAAGSPEVKGKNPFTDVSPDAYYYGAVQWAVKEGITSGTSATAFSPNTTCTRAQAVTFLHRANGSPSSDKGTTFTDVAAGTYYEKAVAWAVEKNITKGTSANEFSPNANCTRAQIVTFLYRANS